MAITDAELIARVLLDDDRHAFGELVRHNQSQIRSLLRRLTCGNAALADDLAQETFLRAYRGLRNYRGGARFSSWLYRIAYNVFLSDKQRHPARPDLPHKDVTSTSVNLARQYALRHDLDRALATLDPAEHAAIALAYGTDATHEEIAELLECPLGTVKTNILRGKDKLRHVLHAWAPEGASP